MKKKITIGELLYFTAEIFYVFGCIYAQTFFSVHAINILVDLIQYSSMILLVFKIIHDNRINKKILIVSSLISVILLVICYFSRNITLILPILLFILAKGKVDDEKIIKIGLLTVSTVTVLTILFAYLGFTDNSLVIYYDGRVRKTLGFSYSTFAPNYFFHSVLMYLFLKKKNINVPETIIISIINYYLYINTLTRAVYYEVILLLIVCWIIKLLNVKSFEKVKWPVNYIFYIMASFTFFFTVLYDSSNSTMALINNLLSKRISLAHAALTKYGFTLFGNFVQFNVNSVYDYVDSSYINTFICYGFLGLVLALLGYTTLIKRYNNANKCLSCVALCFLAIHCVSDPQLLSTSSHQFMFLIGPSILQLKGYYKNKKQYKTSCY